MTTDYKALFEKLAAEAKKQAEEYVPTIAIMGDSGAGKSTLINAIFGKEVAAVGHTGGCTRTVNTVDMSSETGGFILKDFPGVGENPEYHTEYIELYKKELKDVDLVLWALKADVRAYASAIEAYKETVKKSKTPVVFILTQSDKVVNRFKEPTDDLFVRRIAEKKKSVRTEFGLDKKIDIIETVIFEDEDYHYNVDSVVTAAVVTLPEKKKLSFTREAVEDQVNEIAKAHAKKGLFDYMVDYVDEKARDFLSGADEFFSKTLKDQITDAATKVLTTAVSAVLNRYKFW